MHTPRRGRCPEDAPVPARPRHPSGSLRPGEEQGVSIQPLQHGAGVGCWGVGQGCPVSGSSRRHPGSARQCLPRVRACWHQGTRGTRLARERGEKGRSKGWGRGVPRAGQRDVGPALGGHWACCGGTAGGCRVGPHRGALAWITVGWSLWLSTAGCMVQTIGQVTTALHGTARLSTARDSTACLSTAWLAPHCTARLSTAAHSWRGSAQQRVTWRCTTPLGAARHSLALHGTAHHCPARLALAWRCTAQHGSQPQAQLSTAELGTAWLSMTVRSSAQVDTTRHGTARHGSDLHRMVLHCRIWLCTAQHGLVLHGTTQRCAALHGTALHGPAWLGTAWRGLVLLGWAWHCLAQHCMAWHCLAWHGTAWHGLALLGMGWHRLDGSPQHCPAWFSDAGLSPARGGFGPALHGTAGPGSAWPSPP